MAQNSGLPGELAGLVGDSFEAIRYLQSRDASWPDGRAHGSVHEVDHGIDLVTNEVRGQGLSMMWEMSGEDEFLSLSSVELNSEIRNRLDIVDVSNHPAWRSIIGREIVDIATSCHVSNENRPESMWAVRFTLAADVNFAVALGRLGPSGIAYQPDSLVVLFGATESKSYHIKSSMTSAWGG
ncbi:hypothetical protein GCM10009765_48160 [Fodinicola feengrottensis]|uniref:Uncharacterized protein n=1 Tax=Fodinicola feengrottensis TaxID=435914 RepID=A0ABP4TSV1_9ACTN